MRAVAGIASTGSASIIASAIRTCDRLTRAKPRSGAKTTCEKWEVVEPRGIEPLTRNHWKTKTFSRAVVTVGTPKCNTERRWRNLKQVFLLEFLEVPTGYT